MHQDLLSEIGITFTIRGCAFNATPVSPRPERRVVGQDADEVGAWDVYAEGAIYEIAQSESDVAE